MLIDDFLRATIQFSSPNGSDPFVMVWDWRLSSTTSPVTLSLDGPDIVDAIIARYYQPLQSTLSNQISITQVSLRAWAYPSDGYDEAGTLWTGGNGNPLLPPANTFALRLVRANFAMRNGRKAYPGACTTAVAANGTVHSLVQGVFTTLTNAWATTTMDVEFDGGGSSFQEVIVRKPATEGVNPSVYSLIPSYGTVYFGTQNSRK